MIFIGNKFKAVTNELNDKGIHFLVKEDVGGTLYDSCIWVTLITISIRRRTGFSWLSNYLPITFLVMKLSKK